MRWSMLREHPNYARLKGSLEYRFAKKWAMIVCGMVAGWMLILILLLLAVNPDGSFVGRGDTRAAFALVLWLFLLVGTTGYYGYWLVSLFTHLDSYTFTEAVLDRPHQGNRHSMYFTVEVMDRSGNRIDRDTRAIFSREEPNFEQYLNKRVLVGYNEKTDIVVVISMPPQ